jgi:hypothetical protein
MSNNVDFALQLDGPGGILLRGKSFAPGRSEPTNRFNRSPPTPLKTARVPAPHIASLPS